MSGESFESLELARRHHAYCEWIDAGGLGHAIATEPEGAHEPAVWIAGAKYEATRHSNLSGRILRAIAASDNDGGSATEAIQDMLRILEEE